LNKYFLLPIVVALFSCQETTTSNSTEQTITQIQPDKIMQDSIISEHLKNGAWKYHYYSHEWQSEINKGLAKDSTIAYLWQQKAMPLFKQGKYEIGMEFIDKAVKYDRERYQDYRAFIKCIFAKTYRSAILDFQDYKERFGYSYVMDHSYDFYIGLSYIQLNEFEKAKEVLQKDYETVLKNNGEDWLHHLDLFYYGISKYELSDYEGAIELFNLALKKYPEFSEAQYYKAKCLLKLGKREEALSLAKESKQNAKEGYTINEDNSLYERYPYQIRWRD